MNIIEWYESVLPVHGDRNCAHSRLGCRECPFPFLSCSENSPKAISRPAERGNERLFEISFINQDLPERVSCRATPSSPLFSPPLSLLTLHIPKLHPSRFHCKYCEPHGGSSECIYEREIAAEISASDERDKILRKLLWKKRQH